MRVKLALVIIVLLLFAAWLSWAGASPAARAGLLAPAVTLTPQLYLPAVFRDHCVPFTITDPYFDLYQYNMRQINADNAWHACVMGKLSVVVAVIDTGVSLNHPDLVANVDAGYDYVDWDPIAEDGHGHGSNVAGIAGAALNGVGIVGVAPQARIVPVRVLDNSGSGYVSWVANGIIFGADRAQILNLSLGGTVDSSTISDAVNYAVNTRGRLVVAAAGNCGDIYYSYNGCSYMNQPFFPAAYSNVFAVASVNASDVGSSFSTQGSYVDIAAPGENILGPGTGTNYIFASGTSQAAPHVAGLAALIWSRYPTYTASLVRVAIETTSIDLGDPGKDIQYGSGRIDAYAALGLTSLPAPVEPANTRREASTPSDNRQAKIAPGRVLLKFKPGVSIASANRTLSGFKGVSVQGQIAAIQVQVLRVPVGEEWALIDQLRALAEVEYAEPDYWVRAIP